MEDEAHVTAGAGWPRDAGRDALWVGALSDEIVAGRAGLAPLSLLLVELDDAERLVAVEPHGEASATFGRFAQAVRTAVRRQRHPGLRDRQPRVDHRPRYGPRPARRRSDVRIAVSGADRRSPGAARR